MPAGTNMWPFTEVYGTVSPFRSTPEIVATSCRSSMPLVCLKEFIEMSSSWSKPRALALLFLVGCGFTSHGETPGHPIDAPADSPPDWHPADWWDPSWSHRRLITIDTSKLRALLRERTLRNRFASS